MSALLDEIIAARKAKAIEYEEYLKRIAELAKKVEAGQAEDTPEKLDTPGKRALYNNLGQNEELALKIDAAVQRRAPRRLARRPGPRAGDQGGAVWRLAGRRRGRAHLPHHQGADGNTDGHTAQARRNRGGRGAEGHQERPSERLSADRPGAHLRPAADEPRHHPRLRDFEARLDQAAAEEAPEQERETPREYLDRESHYVWGKRYLLKVIEMDAAPAVQLDSQTTCFFRCAREPAKKRGRPSSTSGIASSSRRQSLP